MILDSPTIFGMSGNSLLAGGEAGDLVGVRGLLEEDVLGLGSALPVVLVGLEGDDAVLVGDELVRAGAARAVEQREEREGRIAGTGRHEPVFAEVGELLA